MQMSRQSSREGEGTPRAPSLRDTLIILRTMLQIASINLDHYTLFIPTDPYRHKNKYKITGT